MKLTNWKMLGAAGIAYLTASAAVAEVTLTYSTYIPNVYSVTRGDEWFMDEVEKRSNGEIKFERYWAGALIKAAPDTFDAVQQGAVDVVGSAAAAYSRNELPLQNVSLPFVSSNVRAVSRAMIELNQTNDHVRNELEGRGVKLMYYRAFPNNTAWSQKPIANVEDFKGMKLRSIGLVSDVVQALGAVPVAIQWSEAVEGMERGVVDGMTSVPFDSAVPAGLHEVAAYASDAARMGTNGGWYFMINADKLASLDPAHQEIIMNVAAEASEASLKIMEETNTENVAAMCATESLTVTVFSEEEVEKAKAMSLPAIEAEWIKWATETSGTDAAAVLQQFTDLVRKYETEVEYTPGMDLYMQSCGEN